MVLSNCCIEESYSENVKKKTFSHLIVERQMKYLLLYIIIIERKLFSERKGKFDLQNYCVSEATDACFFVYFIGNLFDFED